MFENINVEKRNKTNLSRASKVSNDVIKKTLVKSKYKNISKKTRQVLIDIYDLRILIFKSFFCFL